jgi:hypothetical protein
MKVATLQAGPPPGLDPAGRRPIGVAWPRGTSLQLGALAGAAGCAALHARVVSAEWGLAALADAAGRAAAGLVASAVAVSAGLPGQPPVSLWLRSDGMRVLIAVWDASCGPPAARREPACSPDAAIGEERGWHAYRGGKVCWSVLGLSPDAGARP